jgi:predicted Zn-dependent protease with MMP-like domain
MIDGSYRFASGVSIGKDKLMDWLELLNIAESVVATTLAELPEPLRDVLAEVPVLMEPCPSAQDVADGIEPDTLGFFDPDPVSRIRLWLENIRGYAEDEGGDYAAEVRTTLLHEIGHVLGWDEDDVEERGLG